MDTYANKSHSPCANKDNYKGVNKNSYKGVNKDGHKCVTRTVTNVSTRTVTKVSTRTATNIPTRPEKSICPQILTLNVTAINEIVNSYHRIHSFSSSFLSHRKPWVRYSCTPSCQSSPLQNIHCLSCPPHLYLHVFLVLLTSTLRLSCPLLLYPQVSLLLYTKSLLNTIVAAIGNMHTY